MLLVLSVFQHIFLMSIFMKATFTSCLLYSTSLPFLFVCLELHVTSLGIIFLSNHLIPFLIWLSAV